MTQSPEPPTCSSPARRRALPAAPVLIRVPAIAPATIGAGRTRVVRRRLRREVRVAGFWLLALIPPAVACATWGGGRPAVLLSLRGPAEATPADPIEAPPAAVALSLSLEPVLAAQPAEASGASVFLTGQLVPVDSPEEPMHGGY